MRGMTLVAEAAALSDSIVALRRAIHAEPEIGLHTPKTRDKIREALVRHAPDVPIVEVPRTDTGAMDDVVLAAAAMAKAGDTVLLAPGCASWDMFRDYAHRGDAFADSMSHL